MTTNSSIENDNRDHQTRTRSFRNSKYDVSVSLSITGTNSAPALLRCILFRFVRFAFSFVFGFWFLARHNQTR
jgi:hypothetical protein